MSGKWVLTQVNTHFLYQKVKIIDFSTRTKSVSEIKRVTSSLPLNLHEKSFDLRCMQMKSKVCPVCGSPMKKNGRTKAGSQRWRCRVCNTSTTHRNDIEQRELKAFLDWLLSKDRQLDMPGQGRTFRRHVGKFWKIWPLPDIVDEIHRVIYVDGIYLSRDAVILIACSDEHVLSWYLARSETTRAWISLLENMAAPEMVVTDGGCGFAKAVARIWPTTAVQRCIFHVFCQVRRCTTTRPKLRAGIELYGIAKDLLHIKTLHQADLWVERFMNWCDFWNDFLDEKTMSAGRVEYTHERLRKARRSLVKLINQNTLFTYLDPALVAEGALPATNNRIEGGVNAQLRDILRNHRGLSLIKRIKAVYWWCYMHTECPLPAKEILRSMPTDDDIDLLHRHYSADPIDGLEPVEWGTGISWSEFHSDTRYPNSIY